MSEQRLAAWRDRRRDPLTFTLQFTDPDTGRPVTRVYEVPDRPTRVWALAYLSDDPVDLLLDVLAEDDADELWEEVRDPDSEVDAALCHRIGKALLGRVTGRPWWAAGRLLVTLAADWHQFIALARDRGLGDPLDWPVEDVCAWVYLKLTANKDEVEVGRIDAELSAPPPGLDPDDEDEAADPDAGADWFAAMQAVGGVAGEDGVARA